MSGIYIHIPFCKQACTYCNFHFSTNLEKKEGFLRALENEINYESDFIDVSSKIETIYFGGGTPSLLKTTELETILNTLQQRFSIHDIAEITLEANPDDISKQTVREWMNAGINRLSIGIQSFDEEELKWMNRAHTASHALECLDIIQETGITNFSADLIFGGPYLSNKQLEKNIEIITKKNIPHISAYALTVEERTALHQHIKSKKSPPVNTEKQAEQFLTTMKLLTESGYEQYEISNYAINGMRSKHNSSYWKGKPYHGFGPSSHSYNGMNIRRWNVPNNSLYISNWLNNKPVYEAEQLSDMQRLNEYIMISLRTIEGIDLKYIEQHFGEEKAISILKKSQVFINKEQLFLKSDKLILTTTGKLFADGISADLFFE